jgi:uncharacterized protein
VIWIWISAILVGVPALVTLGLIGLYFYLLYRYLGFLIRAFEEQPLFIVAPGQPFHDAENVRFPTSDGLELSGCYLHGRASSRRGVIFFGLEFGSNRWGSLPYCQFLLEAGYDVFTFEPRGQGDSNSPQNYRPSQWVTDHDVRDVRAALAYLRSRPDAPSEGAGFFGVSKGAGAGIIAAVDEPYLRCFVTDGIYATRSTMIPYMRRWVTIYSQRFWLQQILPSWYYGLLADAGLRQTAHERGCRFPHLEEALGQLAPRPILMIHGGRDTYITPKMAGQLFARAREPKRLWIVDGARHNQAFRTAPDEYQRRILEFFNQHLPEPFGSPSQPKAPHAIREFPSGADVGGAGMEMPARTKTERGASTARVG